MTAAARKPAVASDAPQIGTELFDEDAAPVGIKPRRTKSSTAALAANDDLHGDPEQENDLFADAGPIKLEPDDLELRSKPRPVKRLNSRAIILITAMALAALAGLFIAALRPPKIKSADQPTELYESNLKPKPAELEDLPKTYEDWLAQIRQGKKPGGENAIPQLGPPLPGDIGHAYAVQTGMAQSSGTATASNYGHYVNSAQASAAQQQHAEQLPQLDQARGSGLFFSGKSSGQSATNPATENADMLQLLSRLGQSPNPVSGMDALASSTGAEMPAVLSAATENSSKTSSLSVRSQQRDEDTLNPHALTALVSPYTVLAGSLIPAALIGDMNSDLPGMVQAHVTENVYDSVSGKWLLIPQGSKLIGHYDARILFGRERALLVWTRLILPHSSSMILEQFNGTDARGQAGLSDQVDWHTGKLVKGMILSSLLGVGSELSVGNSNDSSLRSLARAIQDGGNTASQEIIKRNLEVKPTIRSRSGTRLNVLVSSDLILKPWGDQK